MEAWNDVILRIVNHVFVKVISSVWAIYTVPYVQDVLFIFIESLTIVLYEQDLLVMQYSLSSSNNERSNGVLLRSDFDKIFSSSFHILGDPEVTANLYCNFAKVAWFLAYVCGNFWVTQFVFL